MYEAIQTKIDRISEAQNVLITIREAYQKLVKVRMLMNDLRAIIIKADAFRIDLETNHPDAIGV